MRKVAVGEEYGVFARSVFEICNTKFLKVAIWIHIAMCELC